MRALLDTSFFVATESGRPLGEMPGVTETEVSVVTLAELTVGVLMALYAVIDTMDHEEIRLILSRAVKQEERHVEFGEERTAQAGNGEQGEPLRDHGRDDRPAPSAARQR